MNASRDIWRFGLPLLLAVIVLVIALAGTLAGEFDDTEADPSGEYQVSNVNIDRVDVRLAESHPVQVYVEIAGYLPDPCWNAQEPVVEQDGPRFEIEIVAERKADEVCPQVIEDYETVVELGTVDPGDYVVSVNGVEQEFEVH
ncbi:MAG: hypothetical protein EA415_13565 [Sphaerobacteraceae bacterium]|nr:MAG: hypothetical protein EA415_13565 [Sphaerobacteraceae bacterium]